jgi:lipid II:glycine glycyltransferase (peptidoglycan interpeptide bridge formation enzyme)
MDTTLWQSPAWADYQRALGREVRTYGMENGKWKMENDTCAAALVVIDRTKGGFCTWEIPRGPLWTSEVALQKLLEQIILDAKQDRCIALYLSPTQPFSIFNFQFSISHRHIHPQATRIIDLTQSEDDILAQMHPKGRYNIGVARKHGIEVREGTEKDIDGFYNLLTGTGGRDGFRISKKSHYSRFLSDLEGSFLLIAERQGKPIAGLLGVRWNTTGIYYYGASSYEDRQLMTPYLLQWEAMRKCKADGCLTYDLFGVSPKPAPKNDPWIGISDFKRKFGGTVIAYPPEQMIILKPMVKAMLDLKRKILG